jgi:hypothetical protein
LQKLQNKIVQKKFIIVIAAYIRAAKNNRPQGIR